MYKLIATTLAIIGFFVYWNRKENPLVEALSKIVGKEVAREFINRIGDKNLRQLNEVPIETYLENFTLLDRLEIQRFVNSKCM